MVACWFTIRSAALLDFLSELFIHVTEIEISTFVLEGNLGQ
eukprot:XP_001705506.1 Hypothetical protein GL50803_117981 [Giardia lamblia ATCC 50803]